MSVFIVAVPRFSPLLPAIRDQKKSLIKLLKSRKLRNHGNNEKNNFAVCFCFRSCKYYPPVSTCEMKVTKTVHVYSSQPNSGNKTCHRLRMGKKKDNIKVKHFNQKLCTLNNSQSFYKFRSGLFQSQIEAVSYTHLTLPTTPYV